LFSIWATSPDRHSIVVWNKSGVSTPRSFFSTREQGLGLGLSLCESLAAGMGGSLQAQARSPRGALFRLTLPMAA
jgi:K+-sensing histidine kinase KdpD